MDGHPSQALKGCLLKQLLKPLQHGRLTEKKHDHNCHLAAAASFAELDGTSVDSSTYTGVLDPQLQTMVNIMEAPLCLNHNFPVKELVLLHITEEANLFGIRMKVTQSDNHQVKVAGVAGDLFHVHAHFGNCSRHWTITACEVRIGRQVYTPKLKHADQEEGSQNLEQRKETVNESIAAGEDLPPL